MFGLDRRKLLEQIMKVLGYFSILSCHKAKDVAKPEKTLLQRTNMSCCCVVIFGVNFPSFVFVDTNTKPATTDIQNTSWHRYKTSNNRNIE